MRVRIVSYEDINAWILGKFARKLNEELIKLGVDSDIAKTPDPTADINHHIIYIGYDQSKGNNKDTLMVTHIDDIRKLNQLKKQIQVARVGICMSKALMEQLIIGGIPADKLSFINPAHDGRMPTKRFVIGIASQVKPDGCKREHLIAELAAHISPELFSFKIMGSGWEAVNKVIKNKGFELEYYPDFDYDKYMEFIPSLDYYLYMGQDEGSMGFIDALAAGVKTIVTPQGFHLDAENGITHAFNTLSELVHVFDSIAGERLKLTNAVVAWTWSDYAKKHLEIWNFMKNPNRHYKGSYKDGLNSWLTKQFQPKANGSAYKIHLVRSAIARTVYKIKGAFSDFETFKKKSGNVLRKILHE
jgi:hypothetical protein